MGDHYLLIRRLDKRPNQFSQTIRHLEGGRLYTLKLYTADLDRLLDHTTQERRHAISIAVSGAEQIQDKSFQHVYVSWPYCLLGPYDDQEPEYRNYMTFHYSVFRAKGTTAQLEVFDWLNPDDP